MGANSSHPAREHKFEDREEEPKVKRSPTRSTILRLQTTGLSFMGMGKRSPQPPPTPVQPPPTVVPQIHVNPPADERTASPELTPVTAEPQDRPEIAVDVSLCCFSSFGFEREATDN